MKLRLRNPAFRELPHAGERVRLTDGRIARVVKITTRWETDEDEAGLHPRTRLLAADLRLVPDARAKA